MKILDDVKLEVSSLRERGVEGPLRVVPVVNKHCFVPCGAGRCNCIPTVQGDRCIVREDQRDYCLSDYKRELDFIDSLIVKADAEGL